MEPGTQNARGIDDAAFERSLVVMKFSPLLMGLLLTFVLFTLSASKEETWKSVLDFNGVLESKFLFVFLAFSALNIGAIFFLSTLRLSHLPAGRMRLPILAMSEMPLLLGFTAAIVDKSLAVFALFVPVFIGGYAFAMLRVQKMEEEMKKG